MFNNRSFEIFSDNVLISSISFLLYIWVFLLVLYTNLINTSAKELNDMTVGIEFPNGITPFGKAVLEKSENINEIEKQVSIVCGKEMRVKFIDTKKDNVKPSDSASNSIEEFAKNLDVPFNIMDE